jgi:MFS family permease
MKTECIRKSLMGDFKNVGMAIGIILGIIIGSYIFHSAIVYLITAIKSIEFAIGAYEIFIILGILSVAIGFVINLTTNKKSLVEFGTFPNYMMGVVFVLIFYVCYCAGSWRSEVFNETLYPDVNLIFVIYPLVQEDPCL